MNFVFTDIRTSVLIVHGFSFYSLALHVQTIGIANFFSLFSAVYCESIVCNKMQFVADFTYACLSEYLGQGYKIPISFIRSLMVIFSCQFCFGKELLTNENDAVAEGEWRLRRNLLQVLSLCVYH